MSLHDDSAEEEKEKLNENDSVISLLRDISASLVSLKSQNRSVENRHTACCCRCQYHQDKPAKDADFDTAHLINAIGTVTIQDKPPEAESNSSRVYDNEDIDHLSNGTTEISYGVSSPRDDFTLRRFVFRHNITAHQLSGMRDHLSRLPPDDFRYAVTASRSNFLRQWDQDMYRFPSNSGSRQFSVDSFSCFRDARNRLGVGHFWVRDYDLCGNYAQWDCINSPLYSSLGYTEEIRQLDIPPSKWPTHWAEWPRNAPIAPWRRIM